MGWLVAKLDREQEDIVLNCFSWLQSTIRFPISFLTITHGSGFASQKHFWMETQLIVSGISRGEGGVSKDHCLFFFCKHKLLPLFSSFIENNVTWSKMVLKDFSSESIHAKFDREVMAIVRKDF